MLSRQNARDQLAYWLAERMDQMAFLTMSGVSYNMKNNGNSRSSYCSCCAFAVR